MSAQTLVSVASKGKVTEVGRSTEMDAAIELAPDYWRFGGFEQNEH